MLRMLVKQKKGYPAIHQRTNVKFMKEDSTSQAAFHNRALN